MIKIKLENVSTSNIQELYLEACYYNYIIFYKSNERLIIDIYDQNYNVKFDNEEHQIEFYKLIDFIKSQKFDPFSIPICNCFKSIFCINCLFVKTNKLKIKKDIISFSHKITELKNPKKYLGLFSNIFTYDLPLINNVPNLTLPDILKSGLDIHEALKLYPYFYRYLLYDHSHTITKLDIKDFFNAYMSSANTELYLLNEGILNVLVKSDQEFINLFFTYVGEFIVKMKTTPNLIRLLIGLFHISRFRTIEIIVSYNIFNSFYITDDISGLYYYKLINMIDKFIIERYNLNTKSLQEFKNGFYHFA
ncbi:uncharacterized protein VNE69_09169 [Vairimorpha necatrix]|uniref:Uncharacterized protein n=1 Tax=Vairimorpha necatrix TaxID=6039 RepID=A0AAX4JF52_9MICR